jgi:16S rRNA (guanine527-N7)-methyltransferase
MAELSTSRIAALLQPFLVAGESAPALELSERQLEQFAAYLEVLLRWNQRMNLTAVRDPEEAVRRHFGESLFLARHLAALQLQGSLEAGATLLDVGSGAGFPGIPVKIALPQLRVTLAESQAKKAAFLREAVRVVESSAEVWAARAESLPPSRRFDVVALRAVDNMDSALAVARERLAQGGLLCVLGQPMDRVEARVVEVPESLVVLNFLFA